MVHRRRAVLNYWHLITALAGNEWTAQRIGRWLAGLAGPVGKCGSDVERESLSVFTADPVNCMRSSRSPARRTRGAAVKTETWRPCPRRCPPFWGCGTACGGRAPSARPSAAGEGITLNSCHILPDRQTTQHLSGAAPHTADATWRRRCGPRTDRPRVGLKVRSTNLLALLYNCHGWCLLISTASHEHYPSVGHVVVVVVYNNWWRGRRLNQSVKNIAIFLKQICKCSHHVLIHIYYRLKCSYICILDIPPPTFEGPVVYQYLVV